MSGFFLTPLRGSISPSRYTYTETPIKEAPLELCKAVANIFKTIALEEGDIERLRQVFAHMREFTAKEVTEDNLVQAISGIMTDEVA